MDFMENKFSPADFTVLREFSADHELKCAASAMADRATANGYGFEGGKCKIAAVVESPKSVAKH